MADCDLVTRPATEVSEFLDRFVIPSDRPLVEEWASLVPVVDVSLHDQLVDAIRPEAVEVVEGFGDEVVDVVLARLRDLGAGDDCLVIAAAGSHLGGRESLRYALKDVMGWQPCTLLACVAGDLYFLEDFGDRHLIIHEPTRGQ